MVMLENRDMLSALTDPATEIALWAVTNASHTTRQAEGMLLLIAE